MKKYFKKFFNLIEVLLAMAVLSLGITGVVAMLPVGLNSYQDAISDSAGSDVAESAINILRQYLNLSSNFVDYLSTNDTNVRIGKHLTLLNSPMGTSVSGSEGSQLSSAVEFQDFSVISHYWTDVIGGTAKTGLYKISSYKNVFGVAIPDNVNPDFLAHVIIWKEPVFVQEWDSTNENWILKTTQLTGTDRQSFVLHAEISWPIHVPYKERKKQQFVFGIQEK